jgi:heme exporter protein B
MTVRTSHQEILLPILLLPLLVPVLLGAVGATTGLVAEQEISEKPLRLLVISDAVYLIISFLTFEFVLEE